MAGKSKLTPKQVATIARGKMEGKRQKQIAEEANVSISAVTHPNAAVRSLLEEMRTKHYDRFQRMTETMLVQLESDLTHQAPDVRADARDAYIGLVERSDEALGLSKKQAEQPGAASATVNISLGQLMQIAQKEG